MNDSQVFMLVFMQNFLNFLVLYFFSTRYSRVVNDLNVHFEKTTQLFLDHLAEMYEYGSDYWWNSRRSYDDEDEDESATDSDYEEEEAHGDCEDCDEEEDCDDVEEGEEEECNKEEGCEVNNLTQPTYSYSSSVPQEELFAQNCN